MFIDESRKDAQFKRDLADAIRQSNNVFEKPTSELCKLMIEMASGITKSIEILSQAMPLNAFHIIIKISKWKYKH